MDASAVQSMRNQCEALRDQFNEWQDEAGGMHFEITPQQAEDFRQQGEGFRDSFKGESFGIGPKQMDELHRRMEQFNQQFFGGDSFKFDQPEMERFNQDLKPQSFKLDLNSLPNVLQNRGPRLRTFEDMMRDEQKHERDQLKRQMEEVQALGFDHLA